MQMCVRDDLNEGSDLLIQHMLKLKLDAVARVTAMGPRLVQGAVDTPSDAAQSAFL
jgi:hypothetical protein